MFYFFFFSFSFALNKWHGVSWPKPWPKSQLLVEDAKARLRSHCYTSFILVFPCAVYVLKNQIRTRTQNFENSFAGYACSENIQRVLSKVKIHRKNILYSFFPLKLLNVPLGSHFNDNNNSDNFPRTAGLKSLPQSKHCVSHSCRKLDFIIPFSSFLLGWICLPTFAQNEYLRNSQNALKKYGIAFSMRAVKKLPHFIKELPGD